MAKPESLKAWAVITQEGKILFFNTKQAAIYATKDDARACPWRCDTDSVRCVEIRIG